MMKLFDDDIVYWSFHPKIVSFLHLARQFQPHTSLCTMSHTQFEVLCLFFFVVQVESEPDLFKVPSNPILVS